MSLPVRPPPLLWRLGIYLRVTVDKRQLTPLAPLSMRDAVRPSLRDHDIIPCLCSVFEADTLRTLKSPDSGTDGDKGDVTASAPPTPAGAVGTPSAKKEETEAHASSSLRGIERVLKTRSHFTCLVTRRVAKRSEVIARLQQVS